jgi:hypothetical protein
MLTMVAGHLRRNLVAYIALFFGLAGTSFGAAKMIVPPNSVGTRQLKKNAVTAKKLHRNAVTSMKVKDNSLTGHDSSPLSGGCSALDPGVVFQLPPGYRPANQERFADVNTDGFGFIDVTQAGIACSDPSTAEGGYVTLDGITFSAS